MSCCFNCKSTDVRHQCTHCGVVAFCSFECSDATASEHKLICSDVPLVEGKFGRRGRQRSQSRSRSRSSSRSPSPIPKAVIDGVKRTVKKEKEKAKAYAQRAREVWDKK